MKKYCCKKMGNAVECKKCPRNERYDCKDNILKYIDKFDEYGIKVNKHAIQIIYFCPWCAKKLPKSKRNLWFKALKKLGFNEPSEQNIPEEFKSDKWYNK